MKFETQLQPLTNHQLRVLKDKHDHYRDGTSTKLVKAIRKEIARREPSRDH